ncbi:MAG: flagellar basal body rod modification protein [Albidovulum sp.]|uniref:flagellar hook capping FlgD N-terminal domain-containing protein n=1 Tax=Albidovulum sp. TaxID=1872424 RepID=UPI0013256683|nr:flagellar hook capping FlgD N-terminal domain-containing protein [Defluviimonas sp.]KAB2886571.1 MAG: flagellar basal body rod modification protein [Defluviimonas sp.]
MDVTSATATSAPRAQATTQQGTLINSDFETFLVMLTTQIQNQDPLNPIQSSDYAAQLATFSGVEQQVKTNTLLESLSAQLGMSGMAQMAAWVGMEARVSAPVMFDGTPLTLYPDPPDGAEEAVLVALDATGKEVTRHPIAITDEPALWAGTDAAGAPLPSGTYAFRLETYAAGELSQVTAVEAYSRVSEVRNGAEGALLVLEGGATVAPADIRAVRSPGME